ncbi:hypothetical protein P167DRAFT_579073 [Morchella conica CCBAS932]|uniref:Uncharacterized protein n=1 Tax=Morchella conica CCBAS932 TaxID=1392247 RepID=A0A3N4KGZ1_9PEZI|nr:hypothetical protein P167DRAFT_579073 [Morchella conica CCBAS932]
MLFYLFREELEQGPLSEAKSSKALPLTEYRNRKIAVSGPGGLSWEKHILFIGCVGCVGCGDTRVHKRLLRAGNDEITNILVRRSCPGHILPAGSAAGGKVFLYLGED